jgi:D-glycero-alpha-D-manno-heptose 1-phosphate guanylyltransferase
MEAIVLAGGLGTRLQSVVSDLPKTMAPIGNRPFLEYIFRYLVKNGIDRVILSVGYKWKSIETHFGKRFDKQEIVYSVEDEPLGTGGAIREAIKMVKGEITYIVNGDTYFEVPLDSLRNAFAKEDKLMISLKRMYQFDRYGCVESDEHGLATAFVEKKYCEAGNINGGVYLATRNIFKDYLLEEKFSFEEFIRMNLKTLKIRTAVFDTYFIDIGTPEDYRRAQMEMNSSL